MLGLAPEHPQRSARQWLPRHRGFVRHIVDREIGECRGVLIAELDGAMPRELVFTDQGHGEASIWQQPQR